MGIELAKSPWDKQDDDKSRIRRTMARPTNMMRNAETTQPQIILVGPPYGYMVSSKPAMTAKDAYHVVDDRTSDRRDDSPADEQVRLVPCLNTLT